MGAGKHRRDIVMNRAASGSDPPRCTYCGTRVRRKGTWGAARDALIQFFTLDHIIPRAAGGSNHVKNLAAACFWCNQDRGDMPLDDFVQKLGDKAVITIERAQEMMKEALRYCPRYRGRL